jgi:hypothetical protein
MDGMDNMDDMDEVDEEDEEDEVNGCGAADNWLARTRAPARGDAGSRRGRQRYGKSRSPRPRERGRSQGKSGARISRKNRFA